MKMISPHLSVFVLATFVLLHPTESFAPPSSLPVHSKTSSVELHGKKNKRKGGGGGGQQPRQEKQSVKDQRFDAATRQFMFTLSGLSKLLPDKSKKILDDIYLSFYPGAKIGIVGLNGSG
jgi:ABC-type transport system involved in cytochrome bd biosynthesis fused ATPase/permease subunit